MVDLHYAIKANPMPEIVRFASERVDGLDVASAAELEVALTTDTPRLDISFAGPGKQVFELEAAVAAGVVVNVESETELRRLCEIAAARGTRANVAIRVNPDFQLKSSGMKMGGGAQQFGIDAEQLPDLFGRWKNSEGGLVAERLNFVGFHIYSGSQNLRPDAIRETQSKTCALAMELADYAPGAVRLLNIGGGFGIPYFPGETPLDVRELKVHLHQLAAEVGSKLPDAKLTIELGRYLVGECGVYVCRVSDIKVSRGKKFLITDGGLHHHLAASGNFGQVIRKNYPVCIGNRVNASDSEAVSVVGPLCTPLDLLANDMSMGVAEIGDLAVVFQSGAYGFTASPLGFLSHPAPREIVV